MKIGIGIALGGRPAGGGSGGITAVAILLGGQPVLLSGQYITLGG